MLSGPSFRLDFVFSTEAVVQRCSVKKAFLEVSQNSRENASARASFLIKFTFEEFLRTPFLQNTYG